MANGVCEWTTNLTWTTQTQQAFENLTGKHSSVICLFTSVSS